MLENVQNYIRNNQKWLASEGPNALRFYELFSIKNIDNIDVSKLPKSSHINLVFYDSNEERLIGVNSIEELKEEYGERYLDSDEFFYVLVKIDKQMFNRTQNTDIYFFSNTQKFIDNLSRLEWSDVSKMMQIFLFLDEDTINFESEFLSIKKWSDKLDFESRLIEKKSLSRFNEFNSIYQYVYDEKKINTYFDYPITWQNTVEEENLNELDLLKLKSFLGVVCNKKIGENSFVIRGHKTVLIKVDDGEVGRKVSKNISDLFEFILDRDKHQDKLIILRNTMTIFLNEKSFTNDIVLQIKEILKSVNYNFDLYVQDKVRLFLEQKNKLLQEFITTARKIEELTNQMITQSRGVAISLLGTIFISVLSNVKSAVSISLINVILLSYGAYFLLNAFLVLKQKKQKDNLVESLKRYTEKLGVIGNDESNLSYSTLEKDFIKESVDGFNRFRSMMLVGLFSVSALFFTLYLSIRFNFMPFIKSLIKWVIDF
ncbi:hypothetical protein [Vagococcus fluvialis]|uniref:hypothetical protein n=1 Tax=Vagococcus fluvialis TaxID=2738 RepID=UPI003D109856